MFSLYDITNVVFDHKARDLGEYIKLSFFNNMNIIDLYLKTNSLSINK